MKRQLGGRIIALITTLFLSVTPLAVAKTAKTATSVEIPTKTPLPATPSLKISGSLIFPYLLDNANNNLLVKVRCVNRNMQERNFKRSQVDVDVKRHLVKKYLLQPPPHNQNTPAIVEIEGSCRDVQIRKSDDSHFWDSPVYNPYFYNNPDFDDRWLTREGSGWYWLLHHP
jgi:hypothetical protein